MSTKTKEAGELFRRGHSCSQAVFSAFAPDYGIDCASALKLAGGFGGGMGRLGEVCGAVSGALMVIGLRHGAVEPADKKAKEHNYEMVRRFVEKFKGRNGSIICRELLGFDMSTPEGKAAAGRPGSFDRCPDLVKDAVEILEQMAETDKSSRRQGD
ncbi:MAG: C_GCAxxG_C_C family protein [Phycisphaerales bacterium]|nr:MAG: C_GCAxxG_C_C family protein [Phycisphaerales bacterium]